MPKSSTAGKLRISEADVQKAVVQILELDGWRAIRTDPVSDKSRGKGFGEVGMPDYLFIRYLNGSVLEYPGGHMVLKRPAAEVLWVEFKRKNGVPRAHQVAWHTNENARGGMVRIADDAGDFREWYKTSGLMRHEILT
jgi:hypothetical protein